MCFWDRQTDKQPDRQTGKRTGCINEKTERPKHKITDRPTSKGASRPVETQRFREMLLMVGLLCYSILNNCYYSPYCKTACFLRGRRIPCFRLLPEFNAFLAMHEFYGFLRVTRVSRFPHVARFSWFPSFMLSKSYTSFIRPSATLVSCFPRVLYFQRRYQFYVFHTFQVLQASFVLSKCYTRVLCFPSTKRILCFASVTRALHFLRAVYFQRAAPVLCFPYPTRVLCRFPRASPVFMFSTCYSSFVLWTFVVLVAFCVLREFFYFPRAIPVLCVSRNAWVCTWVFFFLECLYMI